jgi:putative NIF3 family GTP cyclohydrolase 1 type 2
MEAGTVSSADASTGSQTIADIVKLAAERAPQSPALKHKAGEEWRDISYAELGEAVKEIALGLDAFVTGEPTEHVMADAREGGIHFLAGGHYASETFGVRRLGELLEEKFGLEHRFIEVPNPI